VKLLKGENSEYEAMIEQPQKIELILSFPPPEDDKDLKGASEWS
jgi:hypothetical protein